ncbi:hypothetical protein E1264_07520 [Actinomadura sp. KC216]|nr:hypothetical protein E1264_07520 [Actinomadura sp. KC216]
MTVGQRTALWFCASLPTDLGAQASRYALDVAPVRTQHGVRRRPALTVVPSGARLTIPSPGSQSCDRLDPWPRFFEALDRESGNVSGVAWLVGVDRATAFDWGRVRRWSAASRPRRCRRPRAHIQARAHQSKVVEISCQPPGTKVVASSGPQVPLA